MVLNLRSIAVGAAIVVAFAGVGWFAVSNGNAPAGGLIFPEERQPDYWDFFYFATSIGAASQTSDVSIRSKHLRRLVTLHAIISFFFNATVLALAINIGASLI